MLSVNPEKQWLPQPDRKYFYIKIQNKIQVWTQDARKKVSYSLASEHTIPLDTLDYVSIDEMIYMLTKSNLSILDTEKGSVKQLPLPEESQLGTYFRLLRKQERPLLFCNQSLYILEGEAWNKLFGPLEEDILHVGMNVPEELLVVGSKSVLVYKVSKWECSTIPLDAENIAVVNLEDAFYLKGNFNGSEVFIEPSTGVKYDLQAPNLKKAVPINQMTAFNFIVGDHYYSVYKLFKKSFVGKIPENAFFVSKHVYTAERNHIARADKAKEENYCLEANVAVAMLALLFKMSLQKFVIQSLLADNEPEVVKMFFNTYKTYLATNQPLMQTLYRIINSVTNPKAVAFILSLGVEFDEAFESAVNTNNLKLKAPEVVHLVKLMNDAGKTQMVNDLMPKLLRIYPAAAKDLSAGNPENIPHLEKLLRTCASVMPRSMDKLKLLNDMGLGSTFAEANSRLVVIEDLMRYYFATLGRMNQQFARSTNAAKNEAHNTELLGRKHAMSEMIKAQLEVTAEDLKENEEALVMLCLNAVSKLKTEKAEQDENIAKLQKTIVDLTAAIRQKMEDMQDEEVPHEPIAAIPETAIKITGSAREVIESIQSEYNSIIANPTARRMLTSALEKLADDIYSSNIRFIYELIQNADDASFGEGEIPTVRIELRGNEVLFSSNEMGFTAREVQALCDIGGSTKSSSQKIGKKGIGFKSVFKVSNRPSICSGDYSFYFDAMKPLGYIFPNWQDKEAHDKKWTQFTLPLKADIDLVKEFGDLETQLRLTMLFLKQIRRIEFTHNNATSVFTKDSKDEEVSIQFAESTSRYMRISHAARVPPKFVAAKGETTTVSICFPMERTEGTFPAFVYLPVEDNVGFNFAINADLDLVSSREQVHSSSLWNIWLQDQIAQTFSVAVEKFKFQDRILELLPNLKRIHNTYWIATAVKMHDIIKTSKCFCGMSGQMFGITDLLLPVDGIEDLIDSKVVLSALNKDFLNVRSVSTEALADFGFTPFDMQHLVTCLNSTHVEEKDDDWFIKLHEWIDKRFDPMIHGSCLSEARVFKLTNGTITSLDEGPLSYGVDESLPTDCLTLRIIKLIESKVPSFWKHFDIKKMDKKDVFEQIRALHFQLPTSADDFWVHTRIIKALNLAEELTKTANYGMLWFPCTVNGVFEWKKNDGLYYPTVHLQALFEGQSVPFMNSPPEDMQTDEWHTFFKQIGVLYGPKVLTTSASQCALSEEFAVVLATFNPQVAEHLLYSLNAQWKVYSQKETKEIAAKVKGLKISIGSSTHTIARSLSAQAYQPLFGSELQLPYFPFDNLDKDLLTSLEVCHEVNALGLLSVWEHLSSTGSVDVKIWKKLFEAMQPIEIPYDEELPKKIYLANNHLVLFEQCLWTVPLSLLPFCHSLRDTYGDGFKELFVQKLEVPEKADFEVYQEINHELYKSSDQASAGQKSLLLLRAMDEDKEWTIDGKKGEFYLPNIKFELFKRKMFFDEIPREIRGIFGKFQMAREIPPELPGRLGVPKYADNVKVKILTSEQPVQNINFADKYKRYCQARASDLHRLLQEKTMEYINSLQVVICKSIIQVFAANHIQRCRTPNVALYDSNVIVITNGNMSLDDVLKEMKFCLRYPYMLKATGEILNKSNKSHKRILDDLAMYNKKFNASPFSGTQNLTLSSSSKFVWPDNSSHSAQGFTNGSKIIHTDEEPFLIDFVPDPVYGREREQYVFEQLIFGDYKGRFNNVNKVKLNDSSFKIEFVAQGKKDKEVHTITWVNAKGETGLPYDITVQYTIKKNVSPTKTVNTTPNKNKAGNTNISMSDSIAVTRYIEVKATKSVPPASFVISKNEFNKSLAEAHSYTFWFVFGDNSYKKFTKDQLDALNYKIVVPSMK